MNLIIIGAGGFGREVYWYARDAYMAKKDRHVLGFADADPSALDAFDIPAKILGSVDTVDVDRDTMFVVAVGDPAVRRRLADAAAARGCRLAAVVHPSAYVAPDATIEPGCIIGPHAFVGAAVSIGANTALNAYSSVGHDAVIGENCVFSPYATVNGGVVVGSDVFLGTHATVLPRQRVGDSSKVSAGAVVHHEVPVGALAVGNPARSRVLFTPPDAG